MRVSPWLAVLGLGLGWTTSAAAQEPRAEVHLAVEDRVTRMLHAIDRVDWSRVRESFTPNVRVDYTALFGGSVETLPIDTLLARWKALVPGFQATQHLIGPVILLENNGRSLTAETQVRGYHYLPGAEGGVWMVAGRYIFAMERVQGEWRIAGITIQVAYEEGDRRLLTIAQARVAAGEGR